ncbi:MarR family winged helix-turn-helix transcriptional regulator [Streptomyces sp. NBC_01565]|uniref:MarR family winged helix-turn-helix transcriptional regulator n=1 Tax=unclassified Streptomyces TaxID=2593676 RepID=UPI0022597D91|nr:MarR family winged helix-turn-helix transcriptional regulator [Streptomyces sp. NBC_01565]MCX4546301.1 MarR family winged helix-turn-helix transcriptional regulator [Streptomyces sp. NBC_01565]
MTQPTPEVGNSAGETGPGATVPVPGAARGGPVSHAIFRLARLHRMFAGQLLRRIGLHPGQELVMMHLWELGPQRQADLVRLMDSDAATMTRTVRRLEQAGFVRRRPSPTDKRASLIEPTAASQALRGEVERVWSQLEEISTAGLSDNERADALRTLEYLEQNLVRAAAEPACEEAEGQTAERG